MYIYSIFIKIDFNLLLFLLFIVTIFVASVGNNNLIVISEIISVIFSIIFSISGGIKAVFLSDLLFGSIMIFSQLSILIHSISSIRDDSWHNFTRSFDNQPFDLNQVFGFWDLTIGGTFMCLYLYGANHAAVTRILSTSSYDTAKKMSIINAIGLTLILFIGIAFGFVIKEEYPTFPSELKNGDQLLLYYIMNKYADLPIFRGLFIGAILSGNPQFNVH